MNKEIKTINSRLKRLLNRMNKIGLEVVETRRELVEKCDHNDVRKENDYIEGGYLNREIFITRLVCNICGKELSKKEKTGGFC